MALPQQQWNFAASMAGLVIVTINVTATTALVMGKISWGEWAAYTGPFNGIALGWVGKAPGQQPQQAAPQ